MHEIVPVPPGVWTRLSAQGASITAATWLVNGPGPVRVDATSGAAPSGTASGYDYPPGRGEMNVALADFAPGVAGAATLWAWSDSGSTVMVSHA